MKSRAIFIIVFLIALVLVLENHQEGDYSFAQSNVLGASEQSDLPDLNASLRIVSSSPLTLAVTIGNQSETDIEGGSAISYEIYVDKTRVLANTNQFIAMGAGDSFEFEYLVPEEIYLYPEHGSVELILDPQNMIEESSEENNSIKVEY